MQTNEQCLPADLRAWLLARAADDASLTRSGFLAGTPDYMSTEQARGESIDARSDLFSLGSVLYTMLTGHAPFRAASPMAVLNRISQDTPRSILVCSPQVPSWLAGFIDRLHSKLPEDRFESAALVGELLEACLRHLQDPVSCPLPAVLVKPNDAPKSKSHLPRVFLGIAFCVVASIAFAILWLPRELAPDVPPIPSPANLVESSQAGTGDAGLDLEFLGLVTGLNQEIDFIEKQLKQFIHGASQIELPNELPAESNAQNSRANDQDKNETIESEFLDDVKFSQGRSIPRTLSSVSHQIQTYGHRFSEQIWNGLHYLNPSRSTYLGHAPKHDDASGCRSRQ